jgi:hypothetical protein
VKASFLSFVYAIGVGFVGLLSQIKNKNKNYICQGACFLGWFEYKFLGP